MTTTITNVCIVGSGFMGSQIALQCAAHDKCVSMYDVRPESFESGSQTFSHYLDEMIESGTVQADQRPAILERVRRTTDLRDAVSEVGLVIEAVREDVGVKREVFAQIDKACATDTILTTNSSSIRISRLESATDRPTLVLNTHFVHPVWRHPFVELMRGSATSDDTLEDVKSFMLSIGILPVVVQRESTGFIFNRIWRAVKKEALKVVDHGVASVEDVDRTWMIQFETPIGPFGLMDEIGLDVVRDIELVYYGQSGDPSDAPPQVLLDKIAAGELGIKTGRGFYDYPDPSWRRPNFLKQLTQED